MGIEPIKRAPTAYVFVSYPLITTLEPQYASMA